jgi:translation elongation factor EF-G
MHSMEWKDNSHKRTMGETIVMGMGAINFESVRGLTKRQAEFRAKSAPYFWELVRTLEDQGWRAVYKQDSMVESMVRADMHIVNGDIVPLDAEFDLRKA